MYKSFFAVATALGTVLSAHAAVVASDNADDAAYSPQPNNGWSAINGGVGYALWTTLGGITGGGTFMSNTRQVDGNNSFAIFANSAANNGFAISRGLSASMTSGEFDASIRFDLAGNGNNLFNIRSGNNTAGFGSGELFSFGVAGGTSMSQLSYTDSTGIHTLANSEDARGAIWNIKLTFDAGAGTYTFSVSDPAPSGFSTTFSGNLEANGNSVGSFGVINSSSGNDQNLIFDSPTFSTVPEPTTVALFSLSGALLLYQMRRRKS
jgi:hypothetical protein